MPQMPMMGMHQEGTNLLSVLINLAFGFVAGLMIFLGAPQVIAYGSSLAASLLKMTGQGASMAAFGGIASVAPYVVLAPIGGMVLKEIASVRSLKSFGYFAAAVFAGFVVAFASKGYFAALLAHA